jgi:hypothetical protein
LSHLVFGKAVRIRHYPVTVSAESRDEFVDATGRLYLLGRLFRFDEAQVRRPARCLPGLLCFAGCLPAAPGLIQLRWESWRAFFADACRWP